MPWTTGSIDGGARVDHAESGDILVQGKIDGASRANLVASGGSIVVEGKIDGGSEATLHATASVSIGTKGGDGDRKIDGGSRVYVVSGGTIDIGGKVDGGSHLWLKTNGATIRVQGKIGGGSQIRYWPPNVFASGGTVDGGANVVAENW